MIHWATRCVRPLVLCTTWLCLTLCLFVLFFTMSNAIMVNILAYNYCSFKIYWAFSFVSYIKHFYIIQFVNSSPGQNGCHFVDDIFRCNFVNEKCCILIEISLKFVPKCPINNNQRQLWTRVCSTGILANYDVKPYKPDNDIYIYIMCILALM